MMLVHQNMQVAIDSIGLKQGLGMTTVYSYYIARQRVKLNREPLIKFWQEIKDINATKAEEVILEKQLFLRHIKFVSNHHTELKFIAVVLSDKSDWLSSIFPGFPDNIIARDPYATIQLYL